MTKKKIQSTEEITKRRCNNTEKDKERKKPQNRKKIKVDVTLRKAR